MNLKPKIYLLLKNLKENEGENRKHFMMKQLKNHFKTKTFNVIISCLSEELKKKEA